MIVFLLLLSLAYIAGTFLVSGLGHLVGLSHFAHSLREHGILPARGVWPAAVLLTTFELTAAGVTGRAALRASAATVEFAVLIACVAAGLGFSFYLRRLVGLHRQRASCGCLPFSAPLTPLSFAPAGAVVLVAALGLISGLALSRPVPIALHALGTGAQGLPVAWGVTLAGLVMLLPASAPSPSGAART
jgi:hypothetical protein